MTVLRPLIAALEQDMISRVMGEWFRPTPELLAHIEHVASRQGERAA